VPAKNAACVIAKFRFGRLEGPIESFWIIFTRLALVNLDAGSLHFSD
jgi:hypothetical protein